MMETPDQQTQIAFIKDNLCKPVVLVGMMGSGKSHVGKVLAKALELDFYDSDSLIEEKAGCSISEVFEVFGEEKFRVSEQRTIMELLEKGPCVIATGGGAVTNTDTLNAIKQQAFSVWLNTDIEILMKRLAGNKNRPLLQNEDPEEVLKNLLQKRESLYAQADIDLEVQQHSVQKTLDRLIKTLSEQLNNCSV